MHVLKRGMQNGISHPNPEHSRQVTRRGVRGVSGNGYVISLSRPVRIFHPSLGSKIAAKFLWFDGIFLASYSLGIWAAIFQVIEAEDICRPIMSHRGEDQQRGDLTSP